MLHNGTRIGPYEISGRLGAGARGEVYRAVDTRDERVVAMKVLPERYAEDATARGRFRREIAALAALSHPAILRIFDYGREQGLLYAVVELLEGESLGDRIEQGPMPWPNAVEVAARVADGLVAAHENGVIHRDLKPHNVFLTTDGGVKILDFGFAWLEESMLGDSTDSAPIKTGPGVMLGTVPYMSPEQICGLPVDARTDLFSLGCVLYEMLSGKTIFWRKTMVAAMSSILKDPAPSFADLDVVAPAALEAVARRLVDKSPDQRFQTAAEAAEALRTL